MRQRKLKWIAIATLVVVTASCVWLWQEITGTPKALLTDKHRPGGLLINNVKLISMLPGAAGVEEQSAVLILGDHIAEVGSVGEVQAPPGIRTVDGGGRFLIPGLIDAHIHLSDEAELAGYLAHGVTGLRNMSGYPFHLRISGRIREGTLLAPDFITTGPILNSPGPNANLLQQMVTTDAEARAAVREQFDTGYRTVKVYSNLTREAFEAILDEADRLGMDVTGHSPEGVRTPGVPHDKPFDVPWKASLGRGFTTLEHVETIVWHSLRDDLSEQKMREVAAMLAASGEVVTPTLIAHKRLVKVAESKGAYLERPGSDTINPLVRFVERGAEQYWSQVDPLAYEGPHATFFLTATRLLHEAGVPLIAGTDAGAFAVIPGASMTRELELLVQAGLSPYEALSSATRVSAQALGFERTGVIAPGYRANLVLLPEDPLQNIGAVEFPSSVVLRGHWIDESELKLLRQAAGNTSFNRSLWRALQMKLSL